MRAHAREQVRMQPREQARGPAVGNPVEPSEFITNGNFVDGDSGWVVGADWTITPGVAVGVPGNTELLQTLATPLIADNHYVLTFDVANLPDGRVFVEMGVGVADVEIANTTDNGAAQSFPFNPASAFDTISIFTTSSGNGVEIDNVSIAPA